MKQQLVETIQAASGCPMQKRSKRAVDLIDAVGIPEPGAYRPSIRTSSPAACGSAW
jgi:ABC-type microcin C transport system duplicated ATPase subunit YejF